MGIKNQWIHTFFSTAYVVSLGVAVLIVYVMSVPIDNALQGGYVAAVILSGCAMGTASVFFRELTEGLGCALGGFCVSMWLLCLVPGGLLREVAAKAIFISCFTVVGFAFYFSRYTRDWALIVMISFGGATAVVLGVDCFSRAGLKEFWAYVWQLNKNLFPLGADTYPVTKGVRVETAAIIIVFLVGIVSQIKLWRIVREKREQRAAERAEGQRNLEQEEADVGRQVEEFNTRDRQEWERVYGNGEGGSSSGSGASGDCGSEKKLGDSYPRQSEVEVIEMTNMSDSDRGHNGADPLTEKDEDGKVTVRVAADDVPEGADESNDEAEEKTSSVPHSESKKRASSSEKKRRSQTTVSEPPEVVPLPFTVPEEEDAKSQGDRSSVATFADDEGKVEERRYSFAKRLSQGSTRLLRNLSLRSGHTRNSPSMNQGESSEELVISKAEREDDESSVAATFDGQSLDGSNRYSMPHAEAGPDIQISAKLSESDAKPDDDHSAPNNLDEEGNQQAENLQPISTDITPAGSALQNGTGRSEAGTPTTSADRSRVDNAEVSLRSPSKKPKSVSSGASSRVSLTKDRLPRPMSRVALSYRTNEWAKHLSYADAPEPDELHVVEAPKPAKTEKKTKEEPVPVNVEELQQGIEDGVPPAAITRSDSRVSNASASRGLPRRDSRIASSPNLLVTTSVAPAEGGQSLSPTAQHANVDMARSSSGMALRRTSSTFEPIAEEHDAANNPATIPEEQDYSRPLSSSPSILVPGQPNRASIAGVVSYSSPQTLLGQREAALRSRSQGNLFSQSSDPHVMMTSPPSDTSSLSNYPMYASALGADPDDIPLSQRKSMMRQNSLMSVLSNQQPIRHSASAMTLAESTNFDSHQPMRDSSVPPTMVREAKLAQFRNSVATDLRAGSPMITPSGRETPFASTNILLGGRDNEVQRNINMQRNMLMGQKEAEAQRKEIHRREKEWADRAFDEKMRNGELMNAHREAMKRMQKGAKE